MAQAMFNKHSTMQSLRRSIFVTPARAGMLRKGVRPQAPKLPTEAPGNGGRKLTFLRCEILVGYVDLHDGERLGTVSTASSVKLWYR